MHVLYTLGLSSLQQWAKNIDFKKVLKLFPKIEIPQI